MVGPVQSAHPLDGNRARAGALDLSPESDQEISEVDHLRFRRGVFDDGFPLGQAGGHEQVLGPGVARIIQIHARAPQAAGLEPIAGIVTGHLGAHRLEPLNVHINRADADLTAARMPRLGGPQTRQQWAHYQERRPHLSDELGRCCGAGHGAGGDHRRVGIREIDPRPQRPQQIGQGERVLDPGHVAYNARVLGQQGRRHDGQRRVFGAADAHAAPQRGTPVHVQAAAGSDRLPSRG